MLGVTEGRRLLEERERTLLNSSKIKVEENAVTTPQKWLAG